MAALAASAAWRTGSSNRRSCAGSRPAARSILLISDRIDHAVLHQPLDDKVGRLVGREGAGIDGDLRMLGLLIGRVDTGKMLDLAAPGLLVEPLGIAAFRECQRRVDEHLDELARLDQLAR